MLRLKKLVILILYLCVGKKNKKKSFEMLHNGLCMSSGTCTHFQISYTACVPLLIHGVSCSTLFKIN